MHLNTEAKGCRVDEILFAGGASGMPQIAKAITERYGIVPRIEEPETAVVRGAAIHAATVQP